MSEKLRILLAEDHQTVREGIKLLVNSQSDMEVVGEAGNGEIAINIGQRCIRRAGSITQQDGTSGIT